MNMSVRRQTIETMEDRVKEAEDALYDAYVMLDRFSGDMSDEAYHEVEAILGNALEDDFAAESRIHKLEAEVERLRAAVEDARARFIEISNADAFPSPAEDAAEIAASACDRMEDALDAAEDGDDE